jgi:hypothetical protein
MNLLLTIGMMYQLYLKRQIVGGVDDLKRQNHEDVEQLRLKNEDLNFDLVQASDKVAAQRKTIKELYSQLKVDNGAIVTYASLYAKQLQSESTLRKQNEKLRESGEILVVAEVHGFPENKNALVLENFLEEEVVPFGFNDQDSQALVPWVPENKNASVPAVSVPEELGEDEEDPCDPFIYLDQYLENDEPAACDSFPFFKKKSQFERNNIKNK